MNSSPPSALTVKADGLRNRLVGPCMVSDVWDPNSSDPTPPTHQVNALWDTGATNTGISKRVVEKLGLVPDTYGDSHHAQGTTHNVPRYVINLSLPPNVGFSGINVGEVSLPDDVDVLIGMDIIALGDFSVTNKNNETHFSFRIPSQAHVDFVEEINVERARQLAMSKETLPKRSTRERARRKRKR